jgi:hypothetical protein
VFYFKQRVRGNESPFFSLASSFQFFFWATRQCCYVCTHRVTTPCPCRSAEERKQRCHEATLLRLPHRVTTPRLILVLFFFLQHCYDCAGGLPSVPQV